MVDTKKPIRIGIIANAIQARNFYKIVERLETMRVSGIYELDFVAIHGLKKYREKILDSPEEVILISDIVIIHSYDFDYSTKIIQTAFENNLSVITTELSMS